MQYEDGGMTISQPGMYCYYLGGKYVGESKVWLNEKDKPTPKPAPGDYVNGDVREAFVSDRVLKMRGVPNDIPTATQVKLKPSSPGASTQSIASIARAESIKTLDEFTDRIKLSQIMEMRDIARDESRKTCQKLEDLKCESRTLHTGISNGRILWADDE